MPLKDNILLNKLHSQISGAFLEARATTPHTHRLCLVVNKTMYCINAETKVSRKQIEEISSHEMTLLYCQPGNEEKQYLIESEAPFGIYHNTESIHAHNTSDYSCSLLFLTHHV
jgi:hypothetical protein